MANPLITAQSQEFSQFAANIYNGILQGFNDQFSAVTNFLNNTPLPFTTDNQIVIKTWQTLTAIGDVLLGLFVVIAIAQLLYGEHTGTLRLPPGQLIWKTALTAFMMHLSYTIGRDLLILTNNFSEILQPSLTFLLFHFQIKGTDATLLMVIMGYAFLVGLFRVLFQSSMRIVRFILLFVLGGLATATAIHPYTAPIFSAWARLFTLTLLEQFLQSLAFSLSILFLLTVGQHGLPVTAEFILATAAVFFTAQIPNLLARFGASAPSSGSIGNLLMTAVVLFA